MKLIDFLKTENFATGSGFPEGDTVIDLNTVDVEETQSEQYPGKISYRLTFPDGKILFAPKTLMHKAKELEEKGFSKIRVTRTGTGLKDTSYTVIGLKEN